MINAHIRYGTDQNQPLSTHCENTARLCATLSRKFGIEHLGYLAGLLHDMGKANRRFQNYLESSSKGKMLGSSKVSFHHSPVGAIFAYERWFRSDVSFESRLTAQILVMVIHAHHSGFCDIFTPGEASPFLQTLSRDKGELAYDESLANYFAEVCGMDELERLFSQSVDEIKCFWNKITALPDDSGYYAGKGDNVNSIKILCFLLARTLLSCLVDADRWDSACFEYGASPFDSFEPPAPDWKNALDSFEAHLASMEHRTKIDKIRREISSLCASAAEKQENIYRMTVPTGGGKTFSSLRFALKKAVLNPLTERIFYIIPFNTILDQNASDIREVLDDTVPILEHHSNVSYETLSDDEIENYHHLTERWDTKGIILTSMVQFLNSLFRAENSNARRMNHLSNSVLIFDEIQSLPKKCIFLFETAIDYLVNFCNCTVVLCTATQPYLRFRSEPKEIIPLYEKYYSILKRTVLIDESSIQISNSEAANKIANLIEKHGSVLMIVNTKKEASQLYEAVKAKGIPSIHLSTNMYPEHRLRLIRKIKEKNKNEPLFCVSTALIEAGINVSFPCVVRSLAGLGSITQAAGRCNRNAELPNGEMGKVYIWKLKEESLRNLEEIETCAELARGVLTNNPAPDSLESIRSYYSKERDRFEGKFDVRINGVPTSIWELLGKNRVSNNDYKFPLTGAYRTAGVEFKVIEADTRSILVQDGRGEELYRLLSSELAMSDRIRYLREAGRYSISVYEGLFRKLLEEKMIFSINNGEIFVLKKEYYSPEIGLTTEKGNMDLLVY